jgi:hypothetical protein
MLGKVRESAPGPLARDPAESLEQRESSLPAIGISIKDAMAPRLPSGRAGRRGPEPATRRADGTLDRAHRRTSRTHL